MSPAVIYERVSACTVSILQPITLRWIILCVSLPISRLVDWKNGEECIGQKKKNREERKERKVSSTSGIRTHHLLLPEQVHYHCAMGELQMVGSSNELLSDVRESLTPKRARTWIYESVNSVNWRGKLKISLRTYRMLDDQCDPYIHSGGSYGLWTNHGTWIELAGGK